MKAVERGSDELVLVLFAGDGAQLGVAEGIELVERRLGKTCAGLAWRVGEADEGPTGEMHAGGEREAVLGRYEALHDYCKWLALVVSSSPGGGWGGASTAG